MAVHENFDQVFHFNPKAHPAQSVFESAPKTRRKYDGLLFIDRLFGILGIKNSTKLYPPKTNNDLHTLHSAIIALQCPDHHKQTLLYYLLKDFPSPPNSKDLSPADTFATQCFLPEKYRLYVEGLHYLDKQDFRNAMEYLTEPSLLPTFPDEILYVLLKHTKPEERYLAFAYYNSVQPPMASSNILDAYFGHLCASSLQSAFFFARARDAGTHRHLLNLLITSTLSETRSGDERTTSSLQLINLPFSVEEEEWFEDCLLSGDARNCHGAKDTVVVRRMVTGQLDEKGMEGLDERLAGRKIDGLDWAVLMGSLGKATSGR